MSNHKQFGLKVFNICQIGYDYGDGAFSQDDTACSHIGVPFNVPNQSCRSLTLFLCKHCLLFK